MVEFYFDAEDPQIKWADHFADPYDCAVHLWTQPVTDYAPFAELLELAPVDRDTYDELWAWASEHGPVGLSEHTQAQLFRALVRQPPRRDYTGVKLRDRRLRVIGGELVRAYGLKLTRNDATEAECAASVLERLRGTPGERAIERVLQRPQL